MPFGAAMGALIAGSVSSATPVKAPANNFVSFRITSCSLGLLDGRGRCAVQVAALDRVLDRIVRVAQSDQLLGGDEAAIAEGEYRAGAPPMLDPDQMRA
jgi:hypothetical protein